MLDVGLRRWEEGGWERENSGDNLSESNQTTGYRVN